MTIQIARSAPAQIVHLWRDSPFLAAVAMLVGVAVVAGLVAASGL